MTQRIFITGGASGLGRALALRYAKDGAKVCIGDINPEQGAAVAQEIGNAGGEGYFVECDVRRLTDFERVRDDLVQKWGGVDVVVNNAGVASAGAIEDTTMADWEWILDINVLGVVRGCKAFTPLFKAQGAGSFVNIASMAGLMLAPLMASYNVSKAGVIALSETLSQELRDNGIHVCCVCPAFFQTNLTRSMRSDIPGVQQNVNKLMKRSSITADDVAEDIHRAVRDRAFWVLPHARERRLWRLKRHAPRAFDWLMHQESKRWMSKMGKARA
ncbi:SDR family oxidoreductase [Marinobacter lutaoensis]|jgi:NAD(P)-dependent dehydrogenase (short-subunit alcohol dehydrogenase family)|uniref:SDR family oxidoreductase n=1 Tax=Marinobacter lutaoensis TaxID=135739 RepID=UPI000C0A6765|nr:SDR family oxidoreductase [Marinobacter lutaoensis]MBE01879.1 short chain dehydrogenase [Marinobacter sp.]MBI42968.1 short chain dehydrogenase [Oceanospirillales bacterium]NVD34584.1 SDR family oxidoreductase [Marinobacter lutaoensis]|tara:strand:+ start:5352 stop:6170 length:819 start_codon:yes stop_codon:yes gene_type:complete